MVLHLARKLAATVLGQDPSDPSALKELEDLGVPVSDADCRSCADPCNEGNYLFIYLLKFYFFIFNSIWELENSS